MLQEDTWDNLLEEKKRAVINATVELGISTEELRARADVMLDLAEVVEDPGINDAADPPSSTQAMMKLLQKLIERKLQMWW